MLNPSKISCICIFQKRINFLENVLFFFNQQDYPNKELLIVFDHDDVDTVHFLRENKQYRKINLHESKIEDAFEWTCEVDNDINSEIIFMDFKSINDVPNNFKIELAIEQSDADYICLWNAKHFHSRNRLSAQWIFQNFMKQSASVVVTMFSYDKHRDKSDILYGTEEGFNETILFKKSEVGKYSKQLHDLPLNKILMFQKKLAVIDDPELCGGYIQNENDYKLFQTVPQNESGIDYLRKVLPLTLTKHYKTYDAVLTLGCWCQVGSAATAYGLRKIYSPLDGYGIKNWQKVIPILHHKFSDIWHLDNLIIGKQEPNWSMTYNRLIPIYKVYDKQYDLVSLHHFDAIDNAPDQLTTYPQFKANSDQLSQVFISQCEKSETVLFVCKAMSTTAENTIINRDDVLNLCTALSSLRNGRSYKLRLSVPAYCYGQVLAWLQEDQLDQVELLYWDIPWNDNKNDEEWMRMFSDVKLSTQHDEILRQAIDEIAEDERDVLMTKVKAHFYNSYQYEQ